MDSKKKLTKKARKPAPRVDTSRIEVEAPQIPSPDVLAELEKQYQEKQPKKGKK